MNLTSIPNAGATLAPGVFFLVASVANALYAARGLQPSSAFLLLYYFGSASPWPIALPYHLLKTRRWRGLLTIAGLLGLFALTYGLSLIVFLALRGLGAE